MTPHARIAISNAVALIAVYTFFYSIIWKFIGTNSIALLLSTLILIVGVIHFGQQYLSRRTHLLIDATYNERAQFWWTLLGALAVVIFIYLGAFVLQNMIPTLEYDVARILAAAIMVIVGVGLVFQLKPVIISRKHKKK